MYKRLRLHWSFKQKYSVVPLRSFRSLIASTIAPIIAPTAAAAAVLVCRCVRSSRKKKFSNGPLMAHIDENEGKKKNWWRKRDALILVSGVLRALEKAYNSTGNHRRENETNESTRRSRWEKYIGRSVATSLRNKLSYINWWWGAREAAENFFFGYRYWSFFFPRARD